MTTPTRKPEFVLVSGKPFATLPPRKPAPSRMRAYVGRSLATGRLVVFHSDVIPTDDLFGTRYRYAIGPFKTHKGARAMAACDGSPTIVSVKQAEDYSKTEEFARVDVLDEEE